MKANELKRGSLINHNGNAVIIKQMHVQTASSRSGNTLYKAKGKDIVTGQKFEHSYKGDDNVEEMEIERRAVQMLFRDADGCTFMDVESYEQHSVADELLAEELKYLSDGLEGITAIISDEKLLSIELPANVVLKIVETAPAMKAASSSARTKPATLSTGVVVQVPEYLAEGELIKINTENGEFISRAK
ncbi:MAG: elongation factor P-like protein YeiP [Gammaproteobacteria bacterium]|nr:elongation factor P-like protein YeiP [Gammaproteobacteria bacterium]